MAPRLDLAQILEVIESRGLYAIARQVVFYDLKLAAYLGAPTAPWVLPTEEVAVQ